MSPTKSMQPYSDECECALIGILHVIVLAQGGPECCGIVSGGSDRFVQSFHGGALHPSQEAQILQSAVEDRVVRRPCR